MGMTDSQFKTFIRFVLKDIKELVEEKDEAKREEKAGELMDMLQKALED